MGITVESAGTAAESQGTKKRQRSPNYPAVGLEEAIERVGKFYQADGKAGATPEVAAMHLGFTTAHGQAMSVLSALKKFGLIAESNGRMVPTQRAIEILNLAGGDQRRTQAIRDAALSPPIYKELFDQHRNTGLPSNDALQRELVTYKGFNPSAVEFFVKSFRASLEFAGLSDFDALESVSSDQEGSPELHQPLASIGPPPPATFAPASSVATVPPSQQTYRWALSIPRNVVAELKITGSDLKRKDVELLEKQLALLKESFDDDRHET